MFVNDTVIVSFINRDIVFRHLNSFTIGTDYVMTRAGMFNRIPQLVTKMAIIFGIAKKLWRFFYVKLAEGEPYGLTLQLAPAEGKRGLRPQFEGLRPFAKLEIKTSFFKCFNILYKLKWVKSKESSWLNLSFLPFSHHNIQFKVCLAISYRGQTPFS